MKAMKETKEKSEEMEMVENKNKDMIVQKSIKEGWMYKQVKKNKG